MRPSQIRASAVETALMIPKAYSFREAYGHLKMPVAIVAGREDRLIEAQQSAELHRDIAHSTFRCVPNTGTYGTSDSDGRGYVGDRYGEPKQRNAKGEHWGRAFLEGGGARCLLVA